MYKSIFMELTKAEILMNRFFVLALCMVLGGCGSSNSDDTPDTLMVGLNFEITGDLPEVGASSRQAVELFMENLEDSGGIEIAGKTYTIQTSLKDNKSQPEVAVSATTTLISDENVLALIGPNPSFLAVPAGAVANELGTVMVGPWSTNSLTTLNRPWVFRVPYLDTFQGLVLAKFAKEQFSGVNACVLYAEDNAYPRELAQSFEKEWTSEGGTVLVSETFQTGETDFTPQFNNIKNADCTFLFLPQYANEVPAIVEQYHEAEITFPILGADAWASQSLLDDCGDACEGYYITKMFVADGATGSAKQFVDDYTAKFGTTPDDVAALTWDAMLLVQQAMKNCGTITGELDADRLCIREGMASVTNLDAVTGTITFDENGNPLKCISIMQIVDGEFIYYDTVCP